MTGCSQAFIFFGPPGAGKGTLSQMCVEKLRWSQLSTGDLFRKHRSEGTEIGRQIDFAIKSGKLVADELVIKSVIDWIESADCPAGVVIFDGFPRTVVQARLFIELVKEKFPKLRLNVIELEIADEAVMARLGARRICQNKSCQAVYSTQNLEFAPRVEGKCDVCGDELVQREDDSKAEIVRNRLAVYHQHEGALLNFYRENGVRVTQLDAQKSMDEVFENFEKMVKEIQ